ncbi:adenine phosphoribosyltransferase [Iamia majanohamensis]|uniref:Adenine phosphoribosyltransferase n=1 Tax=Iamia majanohamensis TaxID=467976 RepID=A0AAE9Y8G2_9ACTN|nr:adenine phosphoribosyltransferase [Iamia majanohamensis]WCO68990.1 adenine phosphoribosyltransferase [Iamia majanohamensis]
MSEALPVQADPAGLAAFIHEVPDFPSPGIAYKDITPLLADAGALARAVEGMAAQVGEAGIEVDRVVGIESRGFILGVPLALRLGCGFVPVRKPGKLPREVRFEEYALEYGTDRLEVHVDGVVAGHRVLVVDDVIATGGTAAATGRLVTGLGGEVAAFAFLLELSGLGGRDQIAEHPVVSLLTY